MELTLNRISPENQKNPPASMEGVVFGTVFSNHMFSMVWDDGMGWHDAEIKPYQPLVLDPSTIVLHYGQSSFEGLKAYRNPSGGINLFRPRENFLRMNRTAQRMCLPELDIDFVLGALKQLLQEDSDWVPKEEGTSLYIRPTKLATQEALGLKVSSKYLFYIILSPVGPYYPIPRGSTPSKSSFPTSMSAPLRGASVKRKRQGTMPRATLLKNKLKLRVLPRFSGSMLLKESTSKKWVR